MQLQGLGILWSKTATLRLRDGFHVLTSAEGRGAGHKPVPRICGGETGATTARGESSTKNRDAAVHEIESILIYMSPKSRVAHWRGRPSDTGPIHDLPPPLTLKSGPKVVVLTSIFPLPSAHCTRHQASQCGIR